MDITTETTEEKTVNDRVYKIVIAALSLLIIAAAIAIALIIRSNNKQTAMLYAYQEFDPNDSSYKASDVISAALEAFSAEEVQLLHSELSEAHSALEEANAAFEKEKSKLTAELEAKEVELTLKTPPVLDFRKISGMYEGYGELVTLTYNYEVMVETQSTGNIFTNKTLLYSIPGTLKIGVNFDEVKSGITANDASKTVTVTIPAAYFVSNEINESNVTRYDVARGVFSKVEDKDYLNVAGEAKLKAEQHVESNGMLEYAQRLAGLEFIGLLEPITAKSGYEIVVKYNTN